MKNILSKIQNGFLLGFIELNLNFSSIAFTVTLKNILQAHRSQDLNFQKIQKLQRRGRSFIYQMMFKLHGNLCAMGN